ncbi:MAG TPA: helix-turn-helix transcriptional regulator [Burkholderiales bacterium]|nr:helix-turn-helix transcriptional regulator [Burkholderiales bacterium]
MSIDIPTARLELTGREVQVLRLLACGRTYEQASDALGVSLHTVRSHVKNLYRKLGVRSGRAAVWRALELGLLGGAPHAVQTVYD